MQGDARGLKECEGCEGCEDAKGVRGASHLVKLFPSDILSGYEILNV